MWVPVLLLIFAVAFLIVGILRVVEFQDVGLGKNAKRVLIGLHVLGVLLFSFALVLLAVDTDQSHKTVMRALFFSALALLLPIQIYVGLKRRIRIRDLAEEKSRRDGAP